MALAVDASSPARFDGSNSPAINTNITSASFTPPAGAMLVLCVAQDIATTGNLTAGIVVSDSQSLTWQRTVDQDDANHAPCAIYIAQGASNSAMTVSVKNTLEGGEDMHCKVFVITGHDTTSPVGKVVKGFILNNANTISISPTRDSSIIIASLMLDTNSTPTSSDLSSFQTGVGSGTCGASGYKQMPALTGGLNAGSVQFSGGGGAQWTWSLMEIYAARPAQPTAYSGGRKRPQFPRPRATAMRPGIASRKLRRVIANGPTDRTAEQVWLQWYFTDRPAPAIFANPLRIIRGRQ